MVSSARCRIVTFYSYKGGTGRSMHLANVAWILACNGKRVLVIDWDLEAPGLHRYFHPFLVDKELTASDGLIDFLWDFTDAAMTPVAENEHEAGWHEQYADFLPYTTALRWEFPTPGRLDLMPAGRQGPHYAQRVNGFNWQNFYERLGGGVFLEAFKERLRSEYDYILIDSRTGVSDTAGICTVQMPDALVLCFTANNQSIAGSASVAESVREKWRVDPRRPPDCQRILPILTRVDSSEKDKLTARRTFLREKFDRYLPYADPIAIANYWARVEVPYVPWYSYEEVLAVFADRYKEKTSVLAATESLVRLLADDETIGSISISDSERERVLGEFTREEKRAPIDVYLSYTAKDRPIIDKIAHYLTEVEGMNVWYDQMIQIGAKWSDEITGALEKAKSFVIFIGRDELHSGQERELQFALLNSRRLLPVLLPGVKHTPVSLSDRTYLDLRDDLENDGPARLAAAIRGMPFKLPSTFSSELGSARKFKYDVFISYRQSALLLNWVQQLVPLLNDWLTEELGRPARIFYDSRLVPTGNVSASLRTALLASRCLVPILSATYFRSPSCMSEWKTFEQFGATRIIPVVYQGGEHFPPDARKIQMLNFQEFTAFGEGFQKSERFVWFQDAVKKLAYSIAQKIAQGPEAPPADAAFVEVTEAMLPPLPSPPRLT